MYITDYIYRQFLNWGYCVSQENPVTSVSKLFSQTDISSQLTIDGNELSVLFLLKWKEILWVLANTRNTVLSVLFPYALLPPKLNFFSIVVFIFEEFAFGEENNTSNLYQCFQWNKFHPPQWVQWENEFDLVHSFHHSLKKVAASLKKLLNWHMGMVGRLWSWLGFHGSNLEWWEVERFLPFLFANLNFFFFFFCFPCLDWCVDFRWFVCFWPRTLFAWCMWKLPFRVLMPQLGAIGAVLLSWPKFVSTFKSHLPIFKITSFTWVRYKAHGSK